MDITPPSEFTQIVDRHRKAAKLTRSELSARIGYSPSYVSNILNGLRVPLPAFVEAVVSGMGLSKRVASDLHAAAAQLAGYKAKD